MDWEIFMGRFHPLMVHLPIGIFILGYIFEVILQFGFRNLIPSRKIIVVIYSVGLLTGIAAATTGWLLSFTNDYEIEPLNDHKQLGIVTLIVMLFVIIYQIKGSTAKDKLKLAGSTLAITLTALTGHFGGNLTHGSTYITEYGPNFLRNEEISQFEKVSKMNPDSLKIYPHIINPLLKNKCLACHNSQNNKGGLILGSYNNLFKDADHEKPILPGNPDLSELFKRVSLPKTHEKVMPPRGDGLGYTDIQILRYWIENGADSLASFNSDKMTEELIALIIRDYGLDYRPKPYYEKIKADSLEDSLLAQLRGTGFRASYLGKTNLLLDVEFKGDSIGKEQIQMLNQVSNQITFLKISDCKLSDDLIEKIAPIQHLTRIDLSKNQVTERIIPFLIKHSNLDSANLNETEINYESLQNILAQSSLLRVYIWNSKVSPEETSKLTQTFTDVEIISEFRFEEVVEAKSVFFQEETQ